MHLPYSTDSPSHRLVISSSVEMTTGRLSGTGATPGGRATALVERTGPFDSSLVPPVKC